MSTYQITGDFDIVCRKCQGLVTIEVMVESAICADPACCGMSGDTVYVSGICSGCKSDFQEQV